MPNQITEDGIEVASHDELKTQMDSDLQGIYGDDINLDPDTPDGQLENIFIQAILDLEDLIVQVYNSFDPDLAVGNVLDQRVAINGIQRQAGTFTVTDIELVNSQSVNLYGLDQDVQDVYTISDNAGNRYKLQTTQTGLAAGTHTLSFQAELPGANLTIPNTINVPVTIVLGVTSVNNPDPATSIGINEESDAALRIRRQKSVSLGAQGYLASLLAALDNVEGMESAFVYENTDSATDGDGVPGHSIWVIVKGSAAAADIAEAIYKKRNAGCGMKGTNTYVITQVDGTPFTIKWDDVEEEDLYIKFTATSLNGVDPPNTTLIQDTLQDIFVPGVAEKVNINDLATKVQEIDPNTLVTLAGFSLTLMGSYTDTLSPSSKNKYFGVDSSRITIL